MNEDTLDLKPAPGSADHVRGSLDAPVIVTEYADFECPYCGDAARVLDEVLARHGDAVALVFRNYPLPMHPHAEAAAEAAEAAAAAGKFWDATCKRMPGRLESMRRPLRRRWRRTSIASGSSATSNRGTRAVWKARLRSSSTG